MFNIEPFLLLSSIIKERGFPEELYAEAYDDNEWFDRENIDSSLMAISSQMLSREALDSFTSRYSYNPSPCRVALFMAGNIPFVGAADVVYLALCGVDTFIKYASKDRVTMKWFVGLLSQCMPCWKVKEYEDETVDKVIATGSNNSNRYFEYRFASLPSIMRGSRASVAVLTGQESVDELVSLWSDVFLRYGQGCRNVSLLFVPRGYDVSQLLDVWGGCPITNKHYLSLYKQQRAMLAMKGEEFCDGGYYTLHKRLSLHNISSQINIAEYTALSEVEGFISENSDSLQCVVGHGEGLVPFGMAQYPQLSDYADNIDVMDFLLKTK